MIKPIAICVLASLLVAYAVATCLVCPQAILNDTSSQSCVSNTFGTFNVTRSEVANWNCNHPFNKLRVISQTPCTFNNTTDTCGVNTCNTNGPAICATLNGPRGKPLSSAVFSNQCQLNYNNCVNPNQQFTANRISPKLCTMFRL